MFGGKEFFNVDSISKELLEMGLGLDGLQHLDARQRAVIVGVDLLQKHVGGPLRSLVGLGCGNAAAESGATTKIHNLLARNGSVAISVVKLTKL